MEAEERARQIEDGELVDPLAYSTKLLIQEVNFFMDRKAETLARLAELENTLANLTQLNKTSGEISDLKNQVNGLKLSVGFFDRHISTAVYELRTRNNKWNRRVFLWKPLSLTPDDWQSFLHTEGLQHVLQNQMNK